MAPNTLTPSSHSLILWSLPTLYHQPGLCH